ncbi:TPA: 50S ribosomal protein L15 [Candidatus Woesearchaeota archaeon]|nr:50S ribosomal protein L15 [Candidatus Woesearchaeota archaeon]
MVVNKRSKKSRYRGSQTHGGGAKKKRRGAGHRGGRGMAGSGKRADSKKPSIWKEPYFGKRGFTSKSRRKKDAVINLNLLEERLPQFIAQGSASKDKETISVDLGKAGYTKLLGGGVARTRMKVTVSYASQQAVERIKQAGGDVIATGSGNKSPGKEEQA